MWFLSGHMTRQGPSGIDCPSVQSHGSLCHPSRGMSGVTPYSFRVPGPEPYLLPISRDCSVPFPGVQRETVEASFSETWSHLFPHSPAEPGGQGSWSCGPAREGAMRMECHWPWSWVWLGLSRLFFPLLWFLSRLPSSFF